MQKWDKLLKEIEHPDINIFVKNYPDLIIRLLYQAIHWADRGKEGYCRAKRRSRTLKISSMAQPLGSSQAYLILWSKTEWVRDKVEQVSGIHFPESQVVSTSCTLSGFLLNITIPLKILAFPLWSLCGSYFLWWRYLDWSGYLAGGHSHRDQAIVISSSNQPHPTFPLWEHCISYLGMKPDCTTPLKHIPIFRFKFTDQVNFLLRGHYHFCLLAKR